MGWELSPAKHPLYFLSPDDENTQLQKMPQISVSPFPIHTSPILENPLAAELQDSKAQQFPAWHCAGTAAGTNMGIFPPLSPYPTRVTSPPLCLPSRACAVGASGRP